MISSKVEHQAYPAFHDRREYAGLQNAEVAFFPPEGAEPEFLIRDQGDRWNLLHGELLTPEWQNTANGRCAVLRNVTGDLLISW